AAALAWWALLALLLPVGASHLALSWLVPGSLALLCAAHRPRAFMPALLLGSLPGIVVTVAPLRLVLPLFFCYARTGYLGGSPLDPLLALLVAISLSLFAPLYAALHRERAVAPLAWLSLAGLALSLPLLLAAPRYTAERPQRIALVSLQD